MSSFQSSLYDDGGYGVTSDLETNASGNLARAPPSTVIWSPTGQYLLVQFLVDVNLKLNSVTIVLK